MMKKASTAGSIIVILFMVIFCEKVIASSPNYATSSHTSEFYYDGYVQCQPSYNQSGQHAARGYLRYWIGTSDRTVCYNDTGRLYTATGTSITDSRIYSRTRRFYDSLTEFTYKTQFRFGFDWVAHGSNDWITSVGITE